MATRKQKAGAAGALSVAVLAIATAFIAPWEGKRNDPYKDLVGVLTVCYGHTGADIEARGYSDAECMAMLQNDVQAHAEPVLHCTPGLRGHPFQLAAATSLAYNIGGKNYCGSTVARRFNAGDIRGACDAFTMWNRAGGKVVKGLVARRADERTLCLVGAR